MSSSFRQGIAALVAFFTASAVAGIAVAGTPYHLTDLGALDGFSWFTPLAVNTVGGNAEVVGIAQTSDYTHAAAWYWTASSGMVNLQTQLGTTLSSVDSQATGVNASGQIIGAYNDVYNSQTPGTTDGNGFVYTIGGTPAKMAAPGNTNPNGQLPNNFWITAPMGINQGGVACGMGGVGLDPTTKAFTYNVNTAAFNNLSDSTGVNAGASAINKNGWIAGQGPNLTDGTTTNALVWNGTAWTDLGSIAGRATRSRSIDSSGNVVGYSPTSANKKRAFYSHYNGTGWDTMVNLGLLNPASDTGSEARGINDNGQIVGLSYVGIVPNTATAFTCTVSGGTPGSLVQLSTLVANLGGWNLQEATAIDNECNIVGVAADGSGNTKAFLLNATAGDANLDGTVDINDLGKLLTNYNKSNLHWSDGDFDGNGTVDVTDMSKVLTNYNKAVTSAGLSPVPEPASLALLVTAIGSLVLVSCARRKRT